MPRSDCVEGAGWRDRDGYVRLTGGEGAHRVAWRSVYGPIPPGMVVMHTCDNPPCVNIKHLRLGTVADNNRDRAVKGRSAVNINPSPGEANGRALLTEARVREIRELHETEGQKLRGRPRVGITRREIADRFGVSVPTIDAILSGRNWGWLRDEAAQSLAEYALILALIAVVAIVTLALLGTQISTVLQQIGASLGVGG